jgi:hypothetical protein
MSFSQAFQKQPAEQAAEYSHGEEEAGPAGHPLTVGREPASRHDAVQVRMEMKVLSPGVKHGEQADLRAQMLGIAGDGEERFRYGAEEKIVDCVFVVERNAGDLLGDGEDHVEVFGGQQFGIALLDPPGTCFSLAFGAMPVAAGAVSDVSELTVGTPFDSAAQDRGTAVFDGLHQAMLMHGQGVGLAVGGSVLSKQVSQL